MCADMGSPEIRWGGRPGEIYETRCWSARGTWRSPTMTQSVRGNFINLGDVAAELGAHRGHDAQDVVGTAA